jgi:hypothetical protein
MNAVIIYDKCDLALKANALLKNASDRAEAVALWDVKLWQVDLLLSGLNTELALQDAVDAHMIVIAIRNWPGMRSRLFDWLNKWAGCRFVQEATVALFDGAQGSTVSTTPAQDVARFAASHGLGLMYGDTRPRKIESVPFESVPREPEQVLVTV